MRSLPVSEEAGLNEPSTSAQDERLVGLKPNGASLRMLYELLCA